MAAGRPYIQSDKARPTENEQIRIVGAGFKPRQRVTVLIGPPNAGAGPLGTTTAASDGTFEKRVRLPRGMTGAAVLLGCQRSCAVKDTQRIRILP